MGLRRKKLPKGTLERWKREDRERDKPKIDEIKMARVIEPRYFGWLFVPFVGVYGTARKIAKALIQRKDEWLG